MQYTEEQKLLYKKMNALRLEVDSSIVEDILKTVNAVVKEATPQPQGYSLQQVSDAWDAGYDSRYGSGPTKREHLSTLTPAPNVKEVAVKFMDWVTREDSPYAILYGADTRFATNEEDFTIDQVYDYWYENIYPGVIEQSKKEEYE